MLAAGETVTADDLAARAGRPVAEILQQLLRGSSGARGEASDGRYPWFGESISRTGELQGGGRVRGESWLSGGPCRLRGIVAAGRGRYRGLLAEMRPVRPTPVHRTDRLAELVCSNSCGATPLPTRSGCSSVRWRNWARWSFAAHALRRAGGRCAGGRSRGVCSGGDGGGLRPSPDQRGAPRNRRAP